MPPSSVGPTNSLERQVTAMDSIPSYEFHKIFRRLSYDVNLKGALTPDEIDARLSKARKRFKAKAEEADIRGERKRLYKKAKAIEILQERDFAQRTIAEAVTNRYGIVSLTLRFGRERAEEMKLAMERSRLRQKGIRTVTIGRRNRRRLL